MNLAKKNIQLLVGPTYLPERVRKAMDHPALSHRSQEYYDVQHEVTEGVKKILGTSHDLLMLTCSGTGAIEAIIQNLFKPGDQVVIPITGEFGKLIYNVAKPYGLDIKRIDFDYGQVADINQVMDQVTDETKAVLMVHNESSTGAKNDIQAFGEALKDKDTLLIVDAVSSAACVEIQMDQWHIDVVLTASQKGLMSPPGLAFVAMNDKAWDKVAEIANDRYYFNFRKDRKYVHEDRTVHTPATHTALAVREALRMIEEEGLDKVLNRHQDNARYVRQEAQDIGFKLMIEDEANACASLTCIKAPGQAKYYTSELKKRGIEVGGGKNPLGEDTFRIGTMGYVFKEDVTACMDALREIYQEKNRG